MSLSDRVTAAVVRPVYVGYLDIKDDPVFGWTGPGLFNPSGTGDTILDSNTFASVEGAVDISDISEGGGGQPITITFSAHDADENVIRQLVRDRRAWRFRRAKLWRFFLLDDESAVHPEFQQIFSGYMREFTMVKKLGEPATITLTLDYDIQHVQGAELRWIDEPTGWSSFITALANGPLAGGSGVVVPSSGVSRGGASSIGLTRTMNLH